ncbi:efflux RND transporter periplasmic adaptor subunit [Neobacillus mesonae]|uniref:efflux RND transporter periplasmic adaptor subunit n=1 Tax=Neobacillus mesonae TaxID=1193713 RepID=UPI002042486D|nr:efflux RND transporter periplasmic adaptor subunit [Neobacillus mesonae]MCM3571031.1 efflux RND transporter periplasmic adaptor subunit [Neobacillus mesonae]
MKKWIWIAAGIIIVGFIGFQWFNTKNSSAEAIQQVRTAVVQKGKLEVKVSGSGTVESVTSEDIESDEDNKEIDEVLVSEGEKVKEGDELVTFMDGSDPITAPADGTITTVSVKDGDRVTKNQVVGHLTNYEDLQTVVPIDELDIPKVKKNQTASVTVNAYPDQTFTGKVTKVANEGSSENGTSTFDVTIHINQPKSLKVGMSTEASILTETKENALYVPVDAVHTNNNEKYVIAAAESTSNHSADKDSKSSAMAQRKIVKTGIANEEYVEITEGVTEGESIQLPQLAAGTSSSNQQRRMMQGMGGMGQMGGGMSSGGFKRFNNGGSGRGGN